MKNLTHKTNTQFGINIVAFIATMLILLTTSFAQVQLSVSGSSNYSSILIGKQFNFKVNYQVSSLTSSGINVITTIPLPANVEPIDKANINNAITFNSTQINQVNYNASSNIITVSLVSPIAAGSSGQFNLQLKYKEENTPNGYAPNLFAKIDADNNVNQNNSTGPVFSNNTQVPAISDNNFVVTKTKVAGGAINDATIYKIKITGNYEGGLTLTNPTLYDTIPVGATFVSATAFNGSYDATYNATTRIVKWTWIAGSISPDYNAEAFIKVKYLTPTFAIGNTICDGVTLGGEIPVLPFGNTGYSLKNDLPCIILEQATPSIMCDGGKITAATASWLNKHVLTGTTCNLFKNGWTNNGNTELDKVVYLYNIDKSVNVSYITLRPVVDGLNDTIVANLKVEYATNTSGFLVKDNYSNKLIGNQQNVSISVPSGQYITQIRLTITGDISIGSRQVLDYCGNTRTAALKAKDNSPIIEGVTYNEANPGDDGTLIYNNASLSYTYQGNTFSAAGCGGLAEIMKPYPVFNKPQKIVENANYNFKAGDTITYRFRVQLGGTLNALNVSVTDTLDSRLTFLPGSSKFGTSSNMPSNAAFTPTINGNLLSWNLGNLNLTSPYYYVFFKAIINPGTPVCQIANRMSFYSSNALFPNEFHTTEPALVNVILSSAVVAYKGQDGCNNNIVYFPENASAQAGSPINYHITVKNLGNAASKDLVLVDVFPFINDNRGSNWFANLAGPVNINDTATTVYYTTTINPCIVDVTPSVNTPGCNQPVWSTNPPLDITSVKAVKLKRNRNLNPLDSIYLTWHMRAPNGTPHDKIMNNAVTYQVRRTDNSDLLLPSTPNKVGMVTTCNPVYGSIGNFAWVDLNRNGVQDEPTNMGLNGVKVYLFSAGLNNQIGGGDDILLDSTVTGNHYSGTPGYYQFIELTSGKYFVKFSTAFANYSISNIFNQADQTDNNSDIDPLTGFSGLITIDAFGTGQNKHNTTIDAAFNCNMVDPIVSGNNVICFGSSTTLSSTSGAGYQWLLNNQALTNQTNQQIIINTPGTYKVIFKDSVGCQSNPSNAVIVNQNSKISSSILATNGTCANNNVGNIILNVNGGSTPYNYLWSNNDTTCNINNLNAGNYVVTITDANNCQATDSVIITITPCCNVTNGGTISGNQSNCGPFAADTLISINNATGGAGTIEYVWLLNQNNVPFNNGNNGWTVIPNSNVASLNPGTINSTTYFIRCARTVGCTDFVGESNIIKLEVKPAISVNINNLNGACNTGSLGTATAIVTGGTAPITYSWSNASNNASINNLTTGTYQVTVTDANNCTAAASTYISANLLNIDFDVLKSNCIGEYCFINKTQGSSAIDFTWNIIAINGAHANKILCTSSDTNFCFTLPPGKYEVKLKADNNAGCKDSLTKTFTVYPNPKALFNAQTNACASVAYFTNLSFFGETYTWNFGDAACGNLNTNNDTNTIHTFSSNGSYVVTLIATNQAGCADTTTQTVLINPNSVAPKANFTYNIVTTNCATRVYFNNTSTNAISYNWLFTDGSNVKTTNASKSYLFAGTYPVKLVAIGANGCVDTLVQNVIILNNANGALASFVEPNKVQCLDGNDFNFFNTSVFNGGGWISDYMWDFGDSTYDYASTHIYTKRYTTPGTYLVKLIALSPGGCSDTAYQTVEVLPSAIPDFTVTNSCNKTITLTNNTVGAVGNFWEYGDGHYSYNDSTQFNYTYQKSDFYFVTLHSVASNGCKSTRDKGVHTTDGLVPMPDFEYSIICEENVKFKNLSINAPGFAWDFGDSSYIDSTFSPIHAYAMARTYYVTLTVFNGPNCKRSITKPVAAPAGMLVHLPTAIFSYSIEKCSNIINVTNTSTYTTSYQWLLNGVLVSTDETPSIATAGEGIYDLVLIATNIHCSDTLGYCVIIQDAPRADFVYTQNSCSRTVIFNSTSTNSLSYLWNFGDTASALNYGTGTNLSHTFSCNGVFDVTLIVSNLTGCADTVTQILNINATSNASNVDFKFSDPSCNCTCSNKVKFTNLTPGNNNTYFWNFGDGNTSTQANPNKGYSSWGNFTVTLTVTDANGCINSISKNIFIPQSATGVSAGFTTNQPVQCITNNSYKFYNNSSFLGNGFITKYAWNFGDGTIDTTNSYIFNKTYTLPGNYTVTLTAIGSNGCIDTATLNITVDAMPCTNVVYYNGNNNNNNNSNNASSLTPTDVPEIIKKEVLNFTLFPNPNNGNFTLRSSKSINGNIRIYIYDLFGREIYNTVTESFGESEFNINNLNVSESQYFLVIYNDKGEFIDRKSFNVFK